MPSPSFRLGHRVSIIAHRGASRAFHENTIRAFERAVELGVDGIELDVHATRDGVLVVHHDPTLKLRQGAPRGQVAIASMTADQVAAHLLDSGDHVPTLREVFRLVGERATLFVEVKAPHAEALVAALLDEYPAVRSAVHAFDHRIPVGVRVVRPATPIGLLSASYPLDVRGVLAGSHATALWQHADLIDESLVLASHAAGVQLIAWTVNDAPHACQLAAWGVDGICTDVPDVISRALRPAGSP
jgi:glycerophosphoryl diester phosphodiesterase